MALCSLEACATLLVLEDVVGYVFQQVYDEISVMMTKFEFQGKCHGHKAFDLYQHD